MTAWDAMFPISELTVTPFRRKTLSRRLFWTILLNGSVGFLIAIAVWRFQRGGSFPSELTASLIHSSVYGITFGLAMPYLAERWIAFRFPWNWILILTSLLFLAPLTTLVVQICLLVARFIPASKFWPEFGYKSTSVFLIAVVIACCVWAYERVYGEIRDAKLSLRTQQLEKERALTMLAEARLASLESRLHPHFLFNTLNSISALIPEQPNLADEMIQRLAALLRISLATTARESIPLKEEIKIVRDYCEIEKLRLGARLQVKIDVPEDAELVAIPPMILQPLVENSIKYAIAPNPDGGSVEINARRNGNHLVLSVTDAGDGFQLDEVPAGHSIDNLRARLVAVFQDRASLSVYRCAAGSTVTVALPIVFNY